MSHLVRYRIISSLILISTVIVALFFLSQLWFAIIALIICMLAAWEWCQFSGFVIFLERIWIMIFYGLLLIILFFSLICNYIYNQQLLMYSLCFPLGWWFSALLLVLFYPNSALIWRDSKIIRFIFGLLTIVPFFQWVIILRIWHYKENYYSGAILLLYIIIIVWAADSGAYVFGNLFGKHKLAPKVSPGKTWEGLIGGFFSALIISYIYCVLVNFQFTLLKSLMFTILAIFVAMIGDLTESMFKREIKVKDSGHLIPGHGGILDRIDSLTSTIPFFAYLLLYLNNDLITKFVC